jgi:hypothetical protein
MTDQPSTQEGKLKCGRCGFVADSAAMFAAHPTAYLWDHMPEPTTQEAEKALERLRVARDELTEGAMRPVPPWEWEDRHNEFMAAVDALVDSDALRSLRTQHTKDQERIEKLGKEYERARLAYEALWEQMHG